jgi:hypothetical protein
VINPAHAKALKGHKTDARDCARLAELSGCGLLRGSFIASAEQKEVRDLTRYRQVGQVAGVELVLDPAVAEGPDSKRVRQVHLRAGRGQRVRRPVPAVAGLQHHLGVRACPGDPRRQPRRVAGDPRSCHLLAVLGHPDQH